MTASDSDEIVSSPDVYESIKREVAPFADDWVGSLIVTIEIWGRGETSRGKALSLKSSKLWAGTDIS